MRRERRPKYKGYKFIYTAGVIAIFLVILVVASYNVYNKKLKDLSEEMLSSEQIIGLTPSNLVNTENEVEETGSSISKTIEEIQNQMENTMQENTENSNTVENNAEGANTKVEEPEPVKKELSFSYPIEGEILREFAMEELIYSETLDEWTVHQGIDIKADRTTVVKSAEAGTVVAIKNDPRYGLTVIIEHEDGYKTVYSNLLTAEFVTEDEKIEKGQSIGTVGNSAVFEIADEPHLHFEMIKNGEYIDPNIYLK